MNFASADHPGCDGIVTRVAEKKRRIEQHIAIGQQMLEALHAELAKKQFRASGIESVARRCGSDGGMKSNGSLDSKKYQSFCQRVFVQLPERE